MQDFASLRVSKGGWCIWRKILRRCVFQKRVVCYDARFCVAACVQKRVGVLRCKVLHRCVCSKGGWCITTQDFASLCVFQKEGGVLRRKILRRCVFQRVGVLRRKILRRCVLFKWSVLPVSFFSQQFDDAFFTSKVAGTYGKKVGFYFGKGYDLRNPSFVPAIEEQVFIGSKIRIRGSNRIDHCLYVLGLYNFTISSISLLLASLALRLFNQHFGICSGWGWNQRHWPENRWFQVRLWSCPGFDWFHKTPSRTT